MNNSTIYSNINIPERIQYYQRRIDQIRAEIDARLRFINVAKQPQRIVTTPHDRAKKLQNMAIEPDNVHAELQEESCDLNKLRLDIEVCENVSKIEILKAEIASHKEYIATYKKQIELTKKK